MPESNYQVFRNDLGIVDAINRLSDGATVPTWDESDPITIAFQKWLSEHPDFDISDHQPELAIAPIAPPDWESLTDRLRGSALWQRAFGAAMQSVSANATMTLLLNSLTATRSLQDLRFAFLTLRQVMQFTPELSDFTAQELDYLKTALIESGFDPAIVDLA